MTYMTIFQRIKLEFPISLQTNCFGDDGDISRYLKCNRWYSIVVNRKFHFSAVTENTL